MAKNRKAAEAVVIKWVDEILPGGGNGAMYKELFASMSDDQFDAWINKLRRREAYVRLIAPNMQDAKLDFSRNLEIAKKMGIRLYQRLWLTDAKTGETTLTPKRYLVTHQTVRRQQQLHSKKSSTPEDNRHIDELTGQPTGPSKGSRLSLPEWQIFSATNRPYSSLELAKLRGGDLRAFNEMNRQISRTGTCNMADILRAGTRVQSTISVGIILKSMAIDNDL